MKWVGALMFIATTTWIGFEWSRQLNNRPKHIRQLKNALQILEAEIIYSQLPLKEVFTAIAGQIPQPAKSFFKKLGCDMEEKSPDLFTVWEKQVQEFVNSSALSHNEQEILNQFGRTLGQHDFEQQQKQIRLTVNHLERELEEARDHQIRYGKMAKSLGLLCGVFIVILLI